MNPMAEARGLFLSLRADLRASRSTTGRNNRHHDRCPRDILSGVPISVIGMTTSLTTETSLTLAVRLCTMTALATGARRVAGVDGVQWDTCKSGLIAEKLTQLSKRPTALPCTLRVSNRAFRTGTDVP